MVSIRTNSASLVLCCFFFSLCNFVFACSLWLFFFSLSHSGRQQCMWHDGTILAFTACSLPKYKPSSLPNNILHCGGTIEILTWEWYYRENTHTVVYDTDVVYSWFKCGIFASSFVCINIVHADLYSVTYSSMFASTASLAFVLSEKCVLI